MCVDRCFLELPSRSLGAEPPCDSLRLCTKLWFRSDLLAGSCAMPVILEYLPYRLRDWTSRRDECRHSHFALKGFVSVRVDIRGSGDSDGYAYLRTPFHCTAWRRCTGVTACATLRLRRSLLFDEYTDEEQRDGAAVVELLARQWWCNGRVALYGKSWGGFNGLQVRCTLLSSRCPWVQPARWYHACLGWRVSRSRPCVLLASPVSSRCTPPTTATPTTCTTWAAASWPTRCCRGRQSCLRGMLVHHARRCSNGGSACTLQALRGSTRGSRTRCERARSSFFIWTLRSIHRRRCRVVECCADSRQVLGGRLCVPRLCVHLVPSAAHCRLV